MEIVFRKFEAKDGLETQRELFKECFPECIGTPVISSDHYNWKFHSKKGELQSSEFIASSDDGMLGYYAAIPYQYSYNGKILKAAMVCDVMTGVKARGQGVFTKLGIYSTNEFAKLGFDITTGYPIRKEVIPGHLKAGWEQYFELPLFGRFIRFNTFLKKKRIGFLAPLANFLFFLATGFSKLLFLPRNRDLVTENHLSDNIAQIDGLSGFYEKWKTEIPISLVKDLDFLKWRLGAPGQKYHVITLRDRDALVGVLIAREVEKEGVPCMGILELALLREYHQNAFRLIGELTKTAKRVGAELLLVMMGKRWFEKYKLSLNGFMKTPFKFFLIIKQLNPAFSNEMLKNEENWHLMWIDSDDL
ncbi:MAG: GNAT family N-acetyltransferase [Bacteroidota bacterium]